MGFWSAIGLVSKNQLDEHVVNQIQQLEQFKQVILESSLENQKLVKKLCTDVLSKVDELEERVISHQEESTLNIKNELCREFKEVKDVNINFNSLVEKRHKALTKEVKMIREKIDVLEEVLKLNWANQLLDQLETNIQELENQNIVKK